MVFVQITILSEFFCDTHIDLEPENHRTRLSRFNSVITYYFFYLYAETSLHMAKLFQTMSTITNIKITMREIFIREKSFFFLHSNLSIYSSLHNQVFLFYCVLYNMRYKFYFVYEKMNLYFFPSNSSFVFVSHEL